MGTMHSRPPDDEINLAKDVIMARKRSELWIFALPNFQLFPSWVHWPGWDSCCTRQLKRQ